MKPKEQDSSYRGRDSRNAFIPLTTYQAVFSARWADAVVVQCKPGISGQDAMREVFTLLGARYKFDPTDDEALAVWDTTEGFAFLRNFFLAFQGFLVGIGLATLITGGIGVTNIMNVVLEERTKEIGIKMALGARKSTILWQFIVETLVITGVGGLLGFLFAAAVISLAPAVGLEEYIGTPRVDILGATLVVLLLGAVGLLAGVFPARRAANLQPVQALKLF
jgi:putative ABC transport system permease protein